ncbi:MAG: cysteine--tRNA ligase [Candidatus Niyogibacteria bacterium]|nr:MAG: cysteine--tRNA ligase [Candidatus Niyogibacteria bacterium]
MKLFNFLTRKTEIFKPAKGKIARIYACGPTVYNFAHIGNLRTYIFEDIMRRAMELDGFKVKLAMNITDVDDKIIREANKARKTIFEFVQPYERAFFEDLKLLNIKPADIYPKATGHVKEMTGLINKLLKRGLAYESDGSIYFDISKFKNYGRLSRIKPLNLKTLKQSRRSRIDADEYSKDEIEDFVLWKTAKAGEPFWPVKFRLGNSPPKLIKGRPGWHIECSAMSAKYLGTTFDIHAGAVDLLFPHHENEIAQSEGATGKPFVRFFVEGEHLLVDGGKMSKSLGNIYTLRDLEKRGFDPLAFRYLVLASHYRSKLNFTWNSLKAAKNALERIKNKILEIGQSTRIKNNLKFRDAFKKLILNDLDTPKALAVFWKNFNELSLADILWADRILGLNLEVLKPLNIPAEVKKLAQDREKARKVKDWKKADQIRAEIQKLGWSLDDTPKGPIIKPFNFSTL